MRQQISVHIAQSLYRRFKIALAQRGETISAVLRRAVEQYVKEAEEAGE